MEMISMEKAKALLENGIGEAQELLGDPSKVDELLKQIEEKLKDIPLAGSVLADVPLTIGLVKSYITREYKEVSPKVVATLVAAFVYMVKKNDLIPDNIAFFGQLDDVAVLGFALKFVEPELKAYAQWRDAGKPEIVKEAAAEETGEKEEPDTASFD